MFRKEMVRISNPNENTKYSIKDSFGSKNKVESFMISGLFPREVVYIRITNS